MVRFLIYISHTYSIPVGRPLQDEIHLRNYSVKWFCDEFDTYSYLDDTYSCLHTVDEVINYNPDIVLVATNVVADFFPGIKVQIFHGFSSGKRSDVKGHFNIRGFFDLYCTQGPSTTIPFQSLAKKHKYFEILETGWPKMDALFPLENIRHEHKPTIMISSTFTARLSLAKNDAVIREIERISKIGKWIFIAVLHPKMEEGVVNKFKAMQHDSFTFYHTADLIPLYQEADIMLSDTTSAITEFVLQKKPVVTFNNNQPMDYMINVTCVSDIEKSLAYALTKPSEIMYNIESFIRVTHPYSDGQSSVRVIDACIDFLENGKIKVKPLNLIRRGKIRKKLKYFKI